MTVFFTLFIAMQLFAWVFAPEYNQSLSTTYLSRSDITGYYMPLSTLMPTFAIVDRDNLTANDKTYFDFGFRQQIEGGPTEEISAILCKDWVDQTDTLTEAEKDAFRAELRYGEWLLCPDTDELVV